MDPRNSPSASYDHYMRNEGQVTAAKFSIFDAPVFRIAQDREKDFLFLQTSATRSSEE